MSVSRFIFEQYSREWFGLGITDYEGGRYATDLIYGIQDTFAVVGSKDKNREPQEKAKALLIPYFEAAISSVSLLSMLRQNPLNCDCLQITLMLHILLVNGPREAFQKRPHEQMALYIGQAV